MSVSDKGFQQSTNVLLAVVEISARSLPVKYEHDKDLNQLMVDRFVSTSMMYPCNYGYFPQTQGEDGDPLDVLVITPYPVAPGAAIKVRPVGMLAMTDDAGPDHKILAVPVDKLTPLYQKVHNPEDLADGLLQEIAHFFKHYKDLEPGKWANIDGWEKQDVAKKVIEHAIQAYQDLTSAES